MGMDHPQTLVGFMAMYPTQDACRRALFEQPWREGFRCPRCAHEVAWYLRGRGLYECAGCGYQASLTAGTLFHKTRTDLRKWLLAIWLLASMKKPPSAAELSRQLGVTVKTAWLLDVFHGVSAAHLQSYLDEFCYRLNRRNQRLDLFRRILNRCVLYTPPTTYAQLTAPAA